jgi:hypothetical protein
MTETIDRRSVLALAAAGVLAAALPSCSSRHRSEPPPEPDDDDPVELGSYGYDPDVDETGGTAEPPKSLDRVPPAASVPMEWLPPVGNQSMENCFVWSSVYGLATFCAARRSGQRPTSPELQAAPDYSYIRYELASRTASDTCNGGSITKCLDWLRSNGGTPSLAAAPNHRKQGSQPACAVNWSDYQSQPIPPDPRFLVSAYQVARINQAEGLKQLRTIIASGSPVVFGTALFTDFKLYRGGHAPYVGNGELLRDGNGKKKGHAMLVVGYDDHHGDGAVRIQNSWGKRWGDKGFAWVDYRTFSKLAQGKGVYVE